MKIWWKCTTDNCEELNEFETRSNLELHAEDVGWSFSDRVDCWQCGKPHYLNLNIKAELEKAE